MNSHNLVVNITTHYVRCIGDIRHVNHATYTVGVFRSNQLRQAKAMAVAWYKEWAGYSSLHHEQDVLEIVYYTDNTKIFGRSTKLPNIKADRWVDNVFINAPKDWNK